LNHQSHNGVGEFLLEAKRHVCYFLGL
jgi:hypothetical protein